MRGTILERPVSAPPPRGQEDAAAVDCCEGASCRCTTQHDASPPIFCFGCRCVTFSSVARCEAVQDLVRPEEVLERAIALLPSRAGLGDAVADWLRARFDDGSLRFIADPIDCDRWCSPAATLESGGGDCDDLAIVATSLLLALGVDSDFVVGHACSAYICSGHAWVEGWDSRGWFLLEATSGEVHRGGRPDGYIAHQLLRPGLCRLAA